VCCSQRCYFQTSTCSFRSTLEVSIRTIPVYFVHLRSGWSATVWGSKLAAYPDGLLLYKPIDSNKQCWLQQSAGGSKYHWPLQLVGLLYRQFYLNAESDTLCPSTCHASDHILNTHAQCGTQKREPFWRQCKILPAKYAVRTAVWTMRACWIILIFQHCNKEG